MTRGDYEIFKKARAPWDGIGANWFLSYYFGEREFRLWQWHFHHASQKQISVIGGVGSGKTVGVGMSFATFACTTPMFKGMNLAPTGWQSKLMYEAILREANSRPIERFIHRYIEHPYPVITFKSDYIGESRIEFMSAADNAERIQGWEGDMMNLDEAGVILDAEWLLVQMVTRMRGNVPMPSGQIRNRIKKLSCVTANYDFAPAWLWDRMDRALRDPVNFLSMTVKSSENLSEEDIEAYKLVVPEHQWEQMLEGKKPEGQGEHFTVEAVSACENKEMLQYAQYHLLEKANPTKGWRVEESPGAGCTHFEMPPERNRLYLLIGDPGQGNAPQRNAPVVIVWDITGFPDEPCTLRFFKWGYGNGSYSEFKFWYAYAHKTYNPIESCVDSTGTQHVWSEEVLLSMGIDAIGINSSGIKQGMLISAQTQVQNVQFQWPYILGIRSQLVRYSLAEDTKSSKLAQDIVIAIMMTSWHLRNYLWRKNQDDNTPNQPTLLHSARGQRTPVAVSDPVKVDRTLFPVTYK